MNNSELYEKLFREAELDPQNDLLLKQLAEFPHEEVVPVMLNILREDPDKTTGASAIEVIEMIGYPKNEAAIPALITIFGADFNDPRFIAAIDTLFHLPPEVLVSYLVQVLLEQGESYFGEAEFSDSIHWSDIVAGIGYTLSWKKIDKQYSLHCCPAINHLLSQHGSTRKIPIDALLGVIERVALDVDYVIPTLIKFFQEYPEDRYKERVRRLILSYGKDVLIPYERILASVF